MFAADAGTRSARHRAATAGSSYKASGSSRAATPAPGSRSARHSSNASRPVWERPLAGASAAARSLASRSAVTGSAVARSLSSRSAVTGSAVARSAVAQSAPVRPNAARHRAPQSPVSVDGWVKAARNRPQMLLGALVVAGVLLTALPTIPQQDGATTSVMNVAAQAVSRATNAKPAPAETQVAAPIATSRPEPAPTSQSPSAAATPSKPVTEARPAGLAVPKGDGPANSLRTTGSRTVMLSFDDGPDPNETPKILAILAKHDVKAVFCLVGAQATKYPDLVKQISAAGHVLCNHTWNHDLKIGKKKPAQILEDLAKTNAAIRAAVPGARIPYFRAPGGNFTDRLVRVAYTGGGMTSLYWEVDPRDWEHPAGETDAQHVKRVVASVKKETRPGSIILSHDFNQPSTTKAYEQLMPWLVSNFSLGIPGQETTPATTAPTPAPSTSTPAGATPSPSVSSPAPSGSPAPTTPATDEGAAAANATPSATPAVP
ncbi:polysaccharide deacetylase family protein [Actinoplanes sp. OR16]|uniref:polysaccharide deacetylase family protein n=1 Tax=Actinoplanes sp. OR16 TaxID=946334 RepID=UPI00272CFC98|nr:polysaccharide deacetylase family protein [Actinoplanes sp. OR16]